MSSESAFVAPNLDHYIDDAFDNYRAALDSMWDDPEHGARINAAAERIASILVERSVSLIVESDGWAGVAETLADVGLIDDVMLALRLKVGQEFLPTTKLLAGRVLDLTKTTVKAAPNESVRRFLIRVSRCYICGFDNECVIVCRAVVENSVKDAFDRRKRSLPLAANGRSEMNQRLDAALNFGWLSPAARDAARTVWFRGNKAVHADPEAVTDSLDTILLTVKVLAAFHDSAA